MRFLVTGSAGHLGEGLVRTLRARGDEVAGIDLLATPFTTHVGDLRDRGLLERAMRGVDVVLHAATLHKPHIATHTKQQFIETNVGGTLNVLETALAGGVSAVVFTSSTSTFGAALRPDADQPAAWIDESVACVPRNIYGVTKTAAEDLCQLFQRSHGLPCVVLRTSRFFPEADDEPRRRDAYPDANLKTNEFLYRRVDLADAVDAHLLAARRAPELGFGRYVVSATTPFRREHLRALRSDAPAVVASLFPAFETEYARRGWSMLPGIGRVYVNNRACDELGWRPRIDFAALIERLARGAGRARWHARSAARATTRAPCARASVEIARSSPPGEQTRCSTT